MLVATFQNSCKSTKIIKKMKKANITKSVLAGLFSSSSQTLRLGDMDDCTAGTSSEDGKGKSTLKIPSLNSKFEKNVDWL